MPGERPTSLPRWAIYLDGAKIGEIHEEHMPGARLPFFKAIVAHPRTGKPLSLEMHTDLDDRVAVVVAFHRDPMSARQHWA